MPKKKPTTPPSPPVAVKKTDSKVVPVIPDQLQNEFYRKQAVVMADTLHLEELPQFKKLQQSKAVMDAVLQIMLKACGPGFNVQVDPESGVSCKEIEVPKPPDAGGEKKDK